MIILPTMGRPESAKRFIDACRKTGATLPIHVVFDGADAHNYKDVRFPPHWVTVSVPPGTPIGDIFNMMFRNFPNEEFYGIVADDVVPETNIWDIVMRDSCLPDKISWGFDGGQDETLIRHPFIGGDLARKLCFLSAPGIKHWFVDNAWKSISEALNCGVYLPQVKMTHMHPTSGKAPMDNTYLNQSDHMADQVAYVEFMVNQFPLAIGRCVK